MARTAQILARRADLDATLLWPREHGAWAILLVPFLTAVVIAQRATPAVFLALAAVVLAFLARNPVERLFAPLARRAGPELRRVRRFAWMYSLLAAGVGGLLVVAWRLYLLVPLGLVALLIFAFHLWAAQRGASHTLGSQLVNTIGLSLSALVGWVAALGQVNRVGVLVWSLNCAFFCSGVLYVRSRIRARLATQRPEATDTSQWVFLFHLGVMLSVAALVVAGWARPLVVVPFALAAVRVGWGLRRSGQHFTLRQLGWSEVVLSLVFAAFLLLGFRP